jgi:hypothetical protein
MLAESLQPLPCRGSRPACPVIVGLLWLRSGRPARLPETPGTAVGGRPFPSARSKSARCRARPSDLGLRVTPHRHGDLGARSHGPSDALAGRREHAGHLQPLQQLPALPPLEPAGRPLPRQQLARRVGQLPAAQPPEAAHNAAVGTQDYQRHKSSQDLETLGAGPRGTCGSGCYAEVRCTGATDEALTIGFVEVVTKKVVNFLRGPRETPFGVAVRKSVLVAANRQIDRL